MKKSITFSILILMSFIASAQVNLDSLWSIWRNESLDDTTRLKALNDYTVEGYLKGQPDSTYYFAQVQYNFAESKGLKKHMASALTTQGKSFKEKGNYPAAIEFYQKSINISEEINDKHGIADALNHIGYTFQRLGKYEIASDHYNRALKISEEIEDKKAVAIILGDIGYNYFYRSEYYMAITHLKKSLKLNEEVGNKKEVAGCWLRLGNIYSSQGDKLGAIEAYQKSLAYYEELGNVYGIGSCLNNIGNIYKSQGDYSAALNYYKKGLDHAYKGEVAASIPLHNVGLAYSALGEIDSAFIYFQNSLDIREKTGDKRGIASTYHSIGGLYEKNGDFNTALNYYNQSLKIREGIGNKSGVAALLTSIGIIYHLQNDYYKGNINCEKGYLLALEIDDVYRQKFACECLYNGYKALGDGNKALEYHEKMVALKDSLQSGETMNQLHQMEFQKQILADSVAIAEEQHKVQLAHNSEIHAKEKMRNISIGTALFFFFAAGGFYSRWRYVKKSKATIEKERDRSDNLLWLYYSIRLLVRILYICQSRIIMHGKQEKILVLFDELPEQERLTLLDILALKTTKPKNEIDNSTSNHCPHCQSQLRIKHGKKGQLQKYKCKSCNRIYTSRTGTARHNLHKVDKFELYKSLMFDGNYLSLQSIATKVGICIKTAFEWRHKP